MKLWRKILSGVLAFALFFPALPSYAATGTLAPQPLFYGWDANGNPISGGKLYTYTAGTLTPATTYSDVGLTTPNANPIILDSAGKAVIFLPSASFKFILKTSADVTVWTQDNIGAVPATSVSLDVDAVAGETLAAGDAAYLSDGSGSCGATAGRWYKTDADFACSSVTAPAVGMATSAIATGVTGTVRMQGRVTGLSGLSAGATYYLSATAGTITTSAPANARALGAADTTTSFIVTPPPAPFATGSVAGLVSLTAQTLGAGVKTFTSPPVGLPTFARCTADLTRNNTTTFADITGLSFAVGANEVWVFYFVLHAIGTNTSNYKFTLTGPAAPTALRFGVYSFNNLAAASSATAFGSAVVKGGTAAGGLDETITLSGLLRNGANGGVIQAQFAQATAEVFASKVYAESHVMAFRIQ